MDDVRKKLADAWRKLHMIGETYKLKDGLNPSGLDSLLIELDEFERMIHEAKKLAAGYQTKVMYAIAKETTPGEYTTFTHGPHSDVNAMLASSPDDGAILVRIEMKGGEPHYEELKGYLDGEWVDC